MKFSGPTKKLSAYIGEAATYDGKPLYEALVESARTAGCAGATVLRGIEGFGATSRAHGKRAIRMSQDLPVVVVVVDNAPRITALAEVFKAMVADGLITIEDCEVVAYLTGSAKVKAPSR
jgi:PII-like signaling protein